MTKDQLIDRLESRVSDYKRELGEATARADRWFKAYVELEGVFWAIYEQADKLKSCGRKSK